jgi:hypothetical protein
VRRRRATCHLRGNGMPADGVARHPEIM